MSGLGEHPCAARRAPGPSARAARALRPHHGPRHLSGTSPGCPRHPQARERLALLDPRGRGGGRGGGDRGRGAGARYGGRDEAWEQGRRGSFEERGYSGRSRDGDGGGRDPAWEEPRGRREPESVFSRMGSWRGDSRWGRSPAPNRLLAPRAASPAEPVAALHASASTGARAAAQRAGRAAQRRLRDAPSLLQAAPNRAGPEGARRQAALHGPQQRPGPLALLAPGL